MHVYMYTCIYIYIFFLNCNFHQETNQYKRNVHNQPEAETPQKQAPAPQKQKAQPKSRLPAKRAPPKPEEQLH